jgi:hypothetical protein
LNINGRSNAGIRAAFNRCSLAWSIRTPGVVSATFAVAGLSVLPPAARWLADGFAPSSADATGILGTSGDPNQANAIKTLALSEVEKGRMASGTPGSTPASAPRASVAGIRERDDRMGAC